MKVGLEIFRFFAKAYLRSYLTDSETVNGLFMYIKGATKKFQKFFFRTPLEKKFFFEIFLKFFFRQSIALEKLGIAPKGLSD